MIHSAIGAIHRPSRAALRAAAFAAVFLVASSASAQQALFMRIDGVKGEDPANQPLGSDAFSMMTFTVTTVGDSETARPDSADRFGDIKFTLPLTGPAIALWQLAAQLKEVPKASFAAVDATGATLYRVDVEQAVVKTMALQTLGKRSAGIGTMGYQRIRITNGGGKGPDASWDRAKNGPWK